MKGTNYIFTIAIDKYADSMYPNLSNAKLDAERLATVLIRRYGFVTAEKSLVDENATMENIIEALNLLTNTVTENDNLVIYYAGHGQIHPSGKIGYWIPYEASRSSVSHYINNSIVIDYIKAIEAKHILLISDSCFSGTFLSNNRGSENVKHYLKISEKKSRWLLASGREETVTDGQPGKGSPFANSLIDFFERNKKLHLSLLELIAQVQKDTGETTNQQPVCGPIANTGHENGQFVFSLLEPKNKIPKTWEESFKLFCDAKETRLEWPFISKENPETKSLGIWCIDQRSLNRKGKLPPDKFEKLSEAGFVFEPQDEKFYKGLGKFIAFMRKTGLNDVPKKLVKKYASENAWHVVQQRWFNKTPCDKNNPKAYPLYRYELLVKEGIPLNFTTNEKSWGQFQNDLMKFYETHEKLFTIPSQNDKDPEIADLGNKLNDLMESWKKGKLSEEKMKFLVEYVDINFGENKIKRSFEKQIQEYKDFKVLFPNQEPKQTGKYGLLGRRLAGWKTKGKYKKLPDWKIEILKKHNILEEPHEIKTVQLSFDSMPDDHKNCG